MPNTTLNWNRATRRPLFWAGAISEIYTGAVTEEAPTPSPPANLNSKKICQLVEKAVPREETRYMAAIIIKVFLLPSLSAGMLPIKEPIMVPIKAIEIVRPCSTGDKDQYAWIDC